MSTANFGRTVVQQTPPIDGVIPASVTNAVAASELAKQIGSRFGRVVLAPLPSGDDTARAFAVCHACDGLYEVVFAPGDWHFLTYPCPFYLHSVGGPDALYQDQPAPQSTATTATTLTQPCIATLRDPKRFAPPDAVTGIPVVSVAPMIWLETDRPNTTVAAGKITAVVNYGSTADTFSDATGAVAAQCNGLQSAQFPDGGGGQLVSTLPEATYNCIHNGTGAGLGWIARADVLHANGYMLSNMRLGANRDGLDVRANADGSITLLMGNNTAGYMVNATTAPGVLRNGVTSACLLATKSGEAKEFELFVDGVSAASGTFAAPADGVANAAYPLTIGNIAAKIANNEFGGNIPAVYLWPKYPTAAEVASITDYMLRKWQQPRILHLGDSMTSNVDIRTRMRQTLLSSLGVVRFVGPTEAYSGIDSYDYRLTDAYSAGVGGDTIAQVTARVGAAVATNPTHISLQIGTNDIGGGTTAAASLALLDTLATTLIAALPATFSRDRIVLHSIPPIRTAALTAVQRAARDAQRVLFNAALPNLCRKYGFTFVDSGSRLTPADLDADGVHPALARGWNKLADLRARGLAQAIKRHVPDIRPVPRPYVPHDALKCLRRTAGTDTVTIATAAGNAIPPAGSWAVRYRVYLDSLPAAGQVGQLVQFGAFPDGTMSLVDENGHAFLYVNTNVAQIIQQHRFAAGQWYHVVDCWDSVSGKAQKYVNGTAVAWTVAASGFTPAQGWTIGKGVNFNAALGVVADLAICHSGIAGFRLPTFEDLYQDMFDAPPNTCKLAGAGAIYGMHDGAGAVCADSLGGPDAAITGCAWVDLAMPGG
jgi:lysophospholipase L1-like esterase